jgi:hypothetical protein
MKNFPGYTDLFMSPVTGLINISGTQYLPHNYIWVGNRDDVAIAGPSLIDIRLDIINLRKRLNTTPFIIQYPSSDFYNAQALSEVNNGLIANLNGVIVPATLEENNLWIGDSNKVPQPNPIIQIGNLPNLTQNYFWIGDSTNRPIETNVFPSGSLPDLLYQNIWIGDSSNRPQPNQRIGLINLPPFLSADPTVNYGIYNLYTGGINLVPSEPIAPTITLRVDKSNLPNLSKGKIWLGAINITPPLITIGIDGVTVSGNLNWDGRGALPIIGDSYAVPQETGLDPGTIFMGDFENLGQIIQTGLAWGQMFIGNGFGQITTTGLLPFQLFSGSPDASGRIIPITILDRTNLPILPFNNVWIGDGLDQAFPIPIGASLLTTPELTIAPTGVVAGAYPWPAITINAEGRILIASDNTSTIDEIQDNIINNTSDIANNTTNIANNTSAISTISTTLFDPVTGIVTTIFAPVTGLVTVVGGLSTQVSNNTTNIANNSSAIAGIIAGTTPINTNFTGIGDVSGSGPISSSITLTLNTTLNNVPLATGDVNINNHKIINVNDATNPKDAVNLETLEAYVGGLPVTLEGFVIGGPSVGGTLTTARGPDCTLDVIPAANDVSFDNFSITDLETLDFSSWSDMEAKAQNGINFLFLWKFFGGGVS